MNDERERAGGGSAVAIATVLFALLSTWAGVVSKGFLEADACTHYQYSRFVFVEPYRLIDVWGRPWCTFVYAGGVALARRNGAHVIALAIALGMAWLTMRVAKRQGWRWPALAFIFTLGQPLVFLHSFSELTELPFALLLIVAFVAYRERRWWELALVTGAMPLARPEGFGFIAMAAVALLLHRRWWWIPLLGVPLMIWNYGGWELSGRSGDWHNWLMRNWPYAAESMYKPGHLFHFTALLPAVVGPFVFPAVLVGIGVILSKFRWRIAMPHRARCELLIAAIPLMILVGHSYLYWRGKMASNGELRYMLVVAPFWGLLAARGWEWMAQRLQLRHIYRWAGAMVILAAYIQIPKVGYRVLPLRMMDDWTQAGEIARWYDRSSLRKEYPYLINSHPGVPYALDMNPTDPDRTRWWTKREVAQAPAGTLLVWDPVYGVYSSDTGRSVTLEDIMNAGWVPINGPKLTGATWPEWRFFVSPKTIDGRPSIVGGGEVWDGLGRP